MHKQSQAAVPPPKGAQHTHEQRQMTALDRQRFASVERKPTVAQLTYHRPAFLVAGPLRHGGASMSETFLLNVLRRRWPRDRDGYRLGQQCQQTRQILRVT